MSPSLRKIPAVPPSRASVITFQAPASSSSRSHCTHWYGGVDDVRVLRADLGEDGEVAREVGDQLELALARDVDRAVGDLDVREAELGQPALVLVELVLRVDDLEERAADHDGLLAQDVELALEVGRHVRGAPAELDDVDVLAGGLEHVLPRARAEALVEHVGEPAVAAQAEVESQRRAKSSFSFSWAAAWTSW